MSLQENKEPFCFTSYLDLYQMLSLLAENPIGGRCAINWKMLIKGLNKIPVNDKIWMMLPRFLNDSD